MGTRLRTTMSRAAAALAVLAAALVLPAQPVSANHDGMCGYFQYDRSAGSNGPNNSGTLYRVGCSGDWYSWRGGSGTSKNECEVGKGWLPLGWYDQIGHWDTYNGSVIKGWVWWLQNMKCWNGYTWRTELFIHTEQTQYNGQSCCVESQRWDGDIDYQSQGCIKVSHANSGNVHHWYHYAGGTWTHGSHTYTDKLWVWD